MTTDSYEIRLENERFNDYGHYNTAVEEEAGITARLSMEKSGASQEFEWGFTTAELNGAWYVLRSGIPEEVDGI